MTDRELDALFAEKVLGCKVGPLEGWPTRIPCCLCSDTHPHGRLDERDMSHFPALPLYTSDLNAAWEGLSVLAPSRFAVVRHMGSLYTQVEIWTQPDHGSSDRVCESQDSHPAKAIVLACLRAKGVEIPETVVE